MPKSSSATLTPMRLIASTWRAPCSLSLIIALSVSSSSSWPGSMPVRSSTSRTRSGRRPPASWCAETFTATRTAGRPVSCQWRTWRQAVSSAQSPIATISSLSSATGMNSAGDTQPSAGLFQRSSASTVRTRPSRTHTIGW
ncbi:MAG: hypothetical protein BWZ09_02662 [Alphaproteobacteria bacterium ADurb.BinA305]|nr:MAG: hypothetical protein BWZ09_02662 [Alphaproteobacteria bacterium ADurb.BinA305]